MGLDKFSPLAIFPSRQKISDERTNALPERTMTVTQEDYATIEAHALSLWGTDGWDMVYECMDVAAMQEIADRKGVINFDGLFAAVAAAAKLWSEINDDINGY
jgi:hypothetical protein